MKMGKHSNVAGHIEPDLVIRFFGEASTCLQSAICFWSSASLLRVKEDKVETL